MRAQGSSSLHWPCEDGDTNGGEKYCLGDPFSLTCRFYLHLTEKVELTNGHINISPQLDSSFIKKRTSNSCKDTIILYHMQSNQYHYTFQSTVSPWPHIVSNLMKDYAEVQLLLFTHVIQPDLVKANVNKHHVCLCVCVFVFWPLFRITVWDVSVSKQAWALKTSPLFWLHTHTARRWQTQINFLSKILRMTFNNLL